MINSDMNNTSCNYKTFGTCNVENMIFTADKIETLNWKELSFAEILSLPSSNKNIEFIDSVYITVEIDTARLIETPISLKYYKVALLDSNHNTVYENGLVKECPCSKAFQLLPNTENTCLSGRKLLINGTIKQKIAYIADELTQSSIYTEFKKSFSTYIIVYPNFVNVPNILRNIVVIDPLDPSKTITILGYSYTHNDEIDSNLCEEFCVKTCVEDVSLKLMNNRTIFDNVTLFLSAYPATC